MSDDTPWEVSPKVGESHRISRGLSEASNSPQVLVRKSLNLCASKDFWHQKLQGKRNVYQPRVTAESGGFHWWAVSTDCRSVRAKCVPQVETNHFSDLLLRTYDFEGLSVESYLVFA